MMKIILGLANLLMVMVTLIGACYSVTMAKALFPVINLAILVYIGLVIWMIIEVVLKLKRQKR